MPVYPKCSAICIVSNLNGVNFGVKHEKAGNEPTSWLLAAEMGKTGRVLLGKNSVAVVFFASAIRIFLYAIFTPFSYGFA